MIAGTCPKCGWPLGYLGSCMCKGRDSASMRKKKTITLGLTRAGSRGLMRRVNGDGGFQRLLVQLKVAMSPDGRFLTLTPELVEKVNRYANDYGSGGFQSRLGKITTRNLLHAVSDEKPAPAGQAGPGEAIDRPAAVQGGVRRRRALEPASGRAQKRGQ